MTFAIAVERTLGHEAGLSLDRSDRGNWTGGAVGVGELKGTKWGISAASYPYLDIRALTRDQAIQIYRTDYWEALQASKLPAALRFPLFDRAVNFGVRAAVTALQQTLGVVVDGQLGPKTLAATYRWHPIDLLLLYEADRLDAYTDAPTWKVHGRGWVRREAQNLRSAVADRQRADQQPAAPRDPDVPS